MAIAISNLCSTATATDATSYNMPSADYDANALILFSINNSKGTTPDAATISGLTGATWQSVDTFNFNTTTTPQNRFQIFRTMIATSQTAATVTASFGGATQTGFAGIIDQVTGCATSGSDGANAIFQQSTMKSTSGVSTISIGFVTTPTQAVMALFAKQINSSMGIPTQGGGFTGLGDPGANTPAKRIMTAYNLTPTTTMTSTQTASSTLVGFCIEFVVRSAVSGVINYARRTLLGVGR